MATLIDLNELLYRLYKEGIPKETLDALEKVAVLSCLQYKGPLTGAWIKLYAGFHKCSNCEFLIDDKKHYKMGKLRLPKYCSNCGTFMQKEEEK